MTTTTSWAELLQQKLRKLGLRQTDVLKCSLPSHKLQQRFSTIPGERPIPPLDAFQALTDDLHLFGTHTADTYSIVDVPRNPWWHYYHPMHSPNEILPGIIECHMTGCASLVQALHDTHLFVGGEKDAVRQWYTVSTELAEKLLNHNAIVVQIGDLYIWGRTTSGTLYEAPLLRQVAKEMAAEEDTLS